MPKVKVLRYRVVATSPLSLPSLVMELEDGRGFLMGGIPPDVAVGIEKLANGVELSRDPRDILPIFLSRVPELEGVLSRAVVEVVIDDVLRRGESFVYSATVTLTVDGEEERRRMVPSNAILLALLARAQVFVDESVTEGFKVDAEIDQPPSSMWS